MLLACLNASTVLAEDACEGFKWDVSKERPLFAGVPVREIAGREAKSAPIVRADRLYQLQLSPQDALVLTASSARNAATGPAFAGLVRLKAPVPGRYRISIDGPYWLDVRSSGSFIPATDFSSVHGCVSPRKIVVFELPAAARMMCN